MESVHYLKKFIENHIDFPKKGILFKDILPVLREPEIFKKLVLDMCCSEMFKNADAIIAIDARGFIFATAISLQLSKPMVVARKPGKLPGELFTKSYSLEYGNNSLSIQKDSIKDFQKFIIIDDLLATGGTAKCVSKIIKEAKKEVLGLSVVIELGELNAKKNLDFPVISQMIL